MDFKYPVFCPLMHKEISEDICFDIHCIVYGTPKYFAPDEVFETENYEEVCKNCKYHRDN